MGRSSSSIRPGQTAATDTGRPGRPHPHRCRYDRWRRAGFARLHVAGTSGGPTTRHSIRRLQLRYRLARTAVRRARVQRRRRVPIGSGPARARADRPEMPGPSPRERFQTMAEVRAVLEHAATESLTSGPSGHRPSIAVLPFANMSADKENEYFGDGLAEEVINALAQVTGLQVAGRTSSFQFRGKDIELAEVGRRLNVHLLEGSVRRAGNRVRVTAQLIKVADGFHLWSERSPGVDGHLRDPGRDHARDHLGIANQTGDGLPRRRPVTSRTSARMKPTSKLETSGPGRFRNRSRRPRHCSSTPSRSIHSSHFRTAC